jgi:transcriptional regulator with XRE-family HTH domain
MKKDTERDAIIGRLVALLQGRREELGFSLNETAWRAGLSHTMILRVERRDRLPTIETLLRIADALDVDLAAMLADAIQSVRGPRLPSARRHVQTASKPTLR